MNYLSLLNDARISGIDENELFEALQDVENRTTFIRIEPEDLKFFVADNFTRHTGKITDASVKRVPACFDDGMTKRYNRHYLPEAIMSMSDKSLLKESIETGVFFIRDDGSCWPVAPDAISDLQNMLGLRGFGTEVHPPVLFEFLIELAKNQFDKPYLDEGTGNLNAVEGGNNFKIRYNSKKADLDIHHGFTIVRMKDRDSDIEKIFSFRTGKYAPIPQTAIIKVLDRMQGLRSLGLMKKYNMHQWSIDHGMTQVDIRFDEIAEEFNNVFSIKDPVTPCLRLQTSDTGKSSLKISRYLILQRTGQEVTLRLPEKLQDEGAKIDAEEKSYVSTRHIGKTDIEALVDRVNNNLYSAFREVPKAMEELLFLGEADTEETVKTAFHEMRLQRSGVIINQKTEEKIVKKICEDLPKTQNVYDTVYCVLFAAENPDLDITESQREELRQRVLLAIFPIKKYEKIVEDTKTAITAAPSEAIA